MKWGILIRRRETNFKEQVIRVNSGWNNYQIKVGISLADRFVISEYVPIGIGLMIRAFGAAVAVTIAVMSDWRRFSARYILLVERVVALYGRQHRSVHHRF